MKLSVKGMAQDKLPYQAESSLPIWRYNNDMGGRAAGKVVGIKFKKGDMWLVINPRKWWSLMETDEFLGWFIPSNSEAKKSLEKLYKARAEAS